MVLPAWVPSDALAVTLLALIVAMVAMNRNKKWVIRATANKEPLVFAAGVFLIVGAMEGWFQSAIGGDISTWVVLGGILAMAAMLARYTERLEL